MSAAKPGSYKGLTEARKRANGSQQGRFSLSPFPVSDIISDIY